jgi:Tol biopolymer transport system component
MTAKIEGLKTRSIRLTEDGRMKADPVFIRGGEELVFTMQETASRLSLMRLRLANGKVERLHPQATTSEFEPAFSPDGRYCAFVQSRGNLNLKLIIRDTREARDAVFDPGNGFAGMRRPAFAGDAGRVVFSIPTPSGQELASVNVHAQDRRTLFQGGLNNWPSFAPDGRRLVFGSSRDKHFQLYVMDADGHHVRRLTHSAAMDMRPAWSPDGARIVFTSNRDGHYELYLIHPDGTDLRRLTHHAERSDYAAWHPDGRRLAVVAERGGRSDLYLMELPG